MTTFPMPSPRHPFGRNGDGAVLSGPVAERLLRTTRAARAAYDENPPRFARRARDDDFDPRDTRESVWPRPRKVAAEQPAGERTEEASGLDAAANVCQSMMGLANKAGLNGDQISQLEQIVEAVLARHPGGDADPEEQPSIEGSLLKGDPSEHIEASARDKRKAMDSLESLYRAGRLSTRDYEAQGERIRRYGRPTAAGAASFARLFPDAAAVRSGY
jgi:hypothetical protein